jgi:hypothetical protein
MEGSLCLPLCLHSLRTAAPLPGVSCFAPLYGDFKPSMLERALSPHLHTYPQWLHDREEISFPCETQEQGYVRVAPLKATVGVPARLSWGKPCHHAS